MDNVIKKQTRFLRSVSHPVSGRQNALTSPQSVTTALRPTASRPVPPPDPQSIEAGFSGFQSPVKRCGGRWHPHPCASVSLQALNIEGREDGLPHAPPHTPGSG